jgi:hypothetical protein
LAASKTLVILIVLSVNRYAAIKDPRAHRRSRYAGEDVALIDPRGVLKCLCKNQQFSGVLEYWSDGVMENRSYAFFLPEQNKEKLKNIQILLSLTGINTPILSPRRRLYEPEAITPILQGVSISGRADKL